MGHDEITEIDQLKCQIEKMNTDLLRLQDKIAALEAEVKEAYDRGYEQGCENEAALLTNAKQVR